MKRRIISLLLVLAMAAAMLPVLAGQATATEYTQANVEKILQQIIQTYEGTTWNDSFQGSIQCKGFADMVFDKLFGTGGAGYYHWSEYYYLTAPNHCYALGIMEPGYSASKPEDVERVRQLLSQAAPGDFIQMHRTGKDYGHSMIVVSVDADGLTVLDCNFVGSNVVAVLHRSWYFMTLYTDGLSLYRHDGYVPGDYTVTYHANGGDGAPEAETHPMGEAAVVSDQQPTLADHAFLGWSEQMSAQTADYRTGDVCPQKNLTLYAVWTSDRCDFADNARMGQDSGSGLWGDLNGDGIVDEQDLSAFNAVRNGSRLETEYHWALADVNGDGTVDMDDGILLHAFVTDTMASLGHNFVLTEQIPPTMTTAGKERYTCERCGAVQEVTGKTLLEQTMDGFTDVDESRWYYDSIVFAVREGLMQGIDAQHFGTNEPVTRGMLVTILYRHSGDSAAHENPFTDVLSGRYFSKAVAWAADCGVVNGMTKTTFAPDRSVTREQTAAILYRYAALLGMDVSQTADLSGYTDAGKISKYAYPAMAWVNQAGILTGRTKDTLDPAGAATRAEIAQMLRRLLALEA